MVYRSSVGVGKHALLMWRYTERGLDPARETVNEAR